MKPSLIAAALAASAPAWAQDLPPSVVVTGNPLGAKDLATPASVLTGKDLVLRRGSTLWERLQSRPGSPDRPRGRHQFGTAAIRSAADNESLHYAAR